MFGEIKTGPAASQHLPSKGSAAPNSPPLFVPVREADQSLFKIPDSSPQKNKPEDVKKLVGSHIITRRIYPVLVELRIAGRSYRDIAERLGVSESQIRIHLSRAMADYRSGRLTIRSGKSIEEAREVGEEKAQVGLDFTHSGAAQAALNVDNSASVTGISIRV